MAIRIVYRTDDGKIFVDKNSAMAHTFNLKNQEAFVEWLQSECKEPFEQRGSIKFADLAKLIVENRLVIATFLDRKPLYFNIGFETETEETV